MPLPPHRLPPNPATSAARLYLKLNDIKEFSMRFISRELHMAGNMSVRIST